MRARELEEQMWEAVVLGDMEEVWQLLGTVVDIKSRNEIDGWTCLHWACTRNHAPVVSCLLDAGADKQILTSKGELAAQLTSKAGFKFANCCKLLGQPTTPLLLHEENIPDILAESQNESTSISSASQCETSPSTCPASSCCGTMLRPSWGAQRPCSPYPAQGAQRPRSPASLALLRSSGLAWSSPAGLTSAARQVAHPSHASLSALFLYWNFPCNMQELVLKVRLQNLRDNDFIEIELDRQELTYQDLLRVSCCELGVNPEQVEKIRKSPNTLVRKNKDVARFHYFQELELVLVKSDISPFRSAASALTERPGYNSRAVN
uniref:Uncharacterized protein n=1 Tax=Athene cunicularia TaxID=194338 RepID=A0A663LRB3_ATHCN